MLFESLGIQSTAQVRDAIKENGARLSFTDVQLASASVDEHYELYQALKHVLDYN